MPKFTLSLKEHLEYIKMATAVDLRIYPAPSICAMLWERAQAAGIKLGELYVLRQSLEPGVGGSFNSTTRDIWVAYDQERPEEAAKCLLHELAHARRGARKDGDINADWEEEEVVFRLAHQLAVDWGVAEWLSSAQLEEELAQVERYREQHWAAAYLAGTTDRYLARAAYKALYLLAGEKGWDMETFEQALHGWHADESINAAVVDWSRSYLRSSWRLIGFEGGDFGPLALPQGEESAEALRSTMREVARLGTSPGFQRQHRGTWAADFCFLTLTSRFELTRVIAAAQAALLNHPDESALAFWYCYGDTPDASAPRLYRLSISYAEPAPEAELWVLSTPERAHDVVAEAAWQRYIAGWVAPRGSCQDSMTGLRQEPLKEGLQFLWGLQAPVRE